MTNVTDREFGESIPAARYDEDYFLTSCEGYREFIESEGKALSRRLEEAFAVAEVRSGMQVLDVGSGRGEIVRYCAGLGAHAYGIDFAAAANRLASQAIALDTDAAARMGIVQGDAKRLPFPDALFDRVLMFDLVEHLYPWELDSALQQARRVLKDSGRLVIHTAPNRWYDSYAYPLVRVFRTMAGEGDSYPRDPRELVPANVYVHVNEQDMLRLQQTLRRAGFRGKIWLDSPPQRRQEGALLRLLRTVAFGIPPFRWFFEREVFAVARKR